MTPHRATTPCGKPDSETMTSCLQVQQYFDFANFDLPGNKSNTSDKFCGNNPLDLNKLEAKNKCLADFARKWQPGVSEKLY